MNTKTLKIEKQYVMPGNMPAKRKRKDPLLLLISLLLLWFFSPAVLRLADETIGNVDQGIWLLIILSMITYLLLIALTWWLLQYFLSWFKFPSPGLIISQFNTLETWQQFVFLWASYALLLLAALGCLIAIC